MKKLERPIRGIMGIENGGCCYGHGKGKRAASQAFRQTQYVRHHIRLFAGKQGSGSAPSSHDLVSNKQDPMHVTNCTHLGKHCRRVDQHPTRAKYQRLDNECRRIAEGACVL